MARSLLHALIQHLSPLPGIFIQLYRPEQITGLQDNFQSIAQIMRELAQLQRLRRGNGLCLRLFTHGYQCLLHDSNPAHGKYRLRIFPSIGCSQIQHAALTRFWRQFNLRIAARPAVRAGHPSRAEVAELADAHGSGPCTRKGVGVRVPSSAPATEPSKYKRSAHGGLIEVLLRLQHRIGSLPC